MAKSKCPKCESTSFEMKQAEVKGSAFKIMFIQCSICGSILGTTEYYNVGARIEELAKHLNIKLSQ